MKKLINTQEAIVLEMCQGMVLAHPHLRLLAKYGILYNKHKNLDKVTLISGGGSGHEPAHAGFVGHGMLDAAVCGNVFASPSQVQVYQAIKATASHKGTLLIIKNYSGDIMNFNNAAALAREEGMVVESVNVADDIAVEDSLYTVGKRGVAGTIFVHKIAGAAAERGDDLANVKRVAQKAADQVKSLGVAFLSCTVPANGHPTFVLAEDEMEYGVGIHGEPGIQREKILSADALAKRMVGQIVADFEKTATLTEVALLVNGFGATPLMELYLFNTSVMRELEAHNIGVKRVLVGNYMTSIDMTGASLSIMRLDAELETLLSLPAHTPGLTITGTVAPTAYVAPESIEGAHVPNYVLETSLDYSVMAAQQFSLNNMVFLLDKMSAVIIAHEAAFCTLDSHAGDGDFGMSIAKGFRALKAAWPELLAEHTQDIGAFLSAAALIIMEHCGGASGPIWGAAFRAAGLAVNGKQSLNVAEFAAMLEAAMVGIQTTGARAFGRGAVVGDKTLIDALHPCVIAWQESARTNADFKMAFDAGAKAAVLGAEKTKDIVARMGRAGVVGERSLGHPDAGAFGLGVIFTELAATMTIKA